MSTAPLVADIEAGDAAFRRDTRAWLEANCPAEMRQPSKSEADICWGGKRFKFQSDAQAQWMQRMGARGWTVPTWPREAYGGAGSRIRRRRFFARRWPRSSAARRCKASASRCSARRY